MRTTLLALALVLSSLPAAASPVYSGTVAAAFNDPVVVGQYIQTNGTLSAVINNTSTSVYSGMGTNSIQWGACPEVLPEPAIGCGDNGGAPRYSALSFVGNDFNDVAADTEFLLGTLTYTNGTSRSTTVIFGVTAQISVTLSAGGTVDPKTTAAELWTTANSGPANNPRDADLVYFPSDDISFNVLEGASASASVYGSIVGDPYLVFTRLQPNDANGYIGGGPDDFLIPEPATWTLLGAGLASVFLLKRRATAIRY